MPYPVMAATARIPELVRAGSGLFPPLLSVATEGLIWEESGGVVSQDSAAVSGRKGTGRPDDFPMCVRAFAEAS
jgi:hypothetical protein